MPNPLIGLEAAGKISDAVKEGFKLFGQIISGAKMRKLEYNREAAQQYIFIDEKSGEYKDMDDKKRAQLKIHYRKRVFDE